MELEIINYIKRCHTCQIQKWQRTRQSNEAFKPDAPTNPDDKIATNIFVPLSVTAPKNEYILSIQEMLKKYWILIPLRNAASKSIIEGLFEYYIYTSVSQSSF